MLRQSLMVIAMLSLVTAAVAQPAAADDLDYDEDSLCSSVGMDVNIVENGDDVTARVHFPTWYSAMPDSWVAGVSATCAYDIHSALEDDTNLDHHEPRIGAELALHIKTDIPEHVLEAAGLDPFNDDVHHSNPADLELKT